MTRRKRLLSLLLSVLMLCTLLPPRASAAPTLYFTAVNDRMCDLSAVTWLCQSFVGIFNAT